MILHICGDTKDRIKYIRKTELHCFHWDTKCGDPNIVRELAGDKLSLMGGVGNLDTLYITPEDVRKQAREVAEAGINIVGPECAVPLDIKVENLKTISEQIIQC